MLKIGDNGMLTLQKQEKLVSNTTKYQVAQRSHPQIYQLCTVET